MKEDTPDETWCLCILIISMIRALGHLYWNSFSHMLFFTRNRLIVHKGVDFKQIDTEWDWYIVFQYFDFQFFSVWFDIWFLPFCVSRDNFIILQALVASMAYYIFPCFQNLPIWNTKGFIALLILHVIFTEPVYYFLHRHFHNGFLFSHYHSLHHASQVTQPTTGSCPSIHVILQLLMFGGIWFGPFFDIFTAGSATLLEHIVFGSIVAAPILFVSMIGYGSASLIVAYVLTFDFLRCLGHTNVEVVPHKWFNTLPFLRYILYTPT